MGQTLHKKCSASIAEGKLAGESAGKRWGGVHCNTEEDTSRPCETLVREKATRQSSLIIYVDTTPRNIDMDVPDSLSGFEEGEAAVSASARLLLRVRDSADGFGPLKSVAGGLCFILENYEVWFPRNVYLQCSQAFQITKGNKQAIESLASRVRALAESLCKPVPEGDARERERRLNLER